MNTYAFLHRTVILTSAWHSFIRVDAANEVVYELVAEPVQEPHAGEPQEEAGEQAPEQVANPTDLQRRPQSINLLLKLCNVLTLSICALSF